MKPVIVLGSARSDGNTFKAAEVIAQKLDIELINLSEYKIGDFDYQFANVDDDFLPLMRRITSEFDTIIFATPVYWYSMSATLKTFFDRLSDCLHYEKETGRKLRQMNMAMLCSSSSESYDDVFSAPFRKSAEYLGMNYLGDVHTWVEEDTFPEKVLQQLSDFATKFE